MSNEARPSPEKDDLNNPHWMGARRGELLLQQCEHCGHHRFPAANCCPACRREGATWVKASGRGVVETWCRFHKAYWPAMKADLPYRVIQVRLAEGVRLYSNFVGNISDRALVGLPVRAVFDHVSDDVTLVKFAAEVAS